MKRLMAGTLACAASLAISAAAQAAPQNFFFSCPDADVAPVANTSKDTSPSWTSTAPTAKTTDGAGCGEFDPFALVSTMPDSTPSYLADGVFGGEYAGEIKKLDFTLYSTANPVYDNAGIGDRKVNVTIAVDGEILVQNQTMQAPIVAASQPNTYKSTFSVTGLDVARTKAAKQVNIVVNSLYSDSPTVWLEGSADFPSSAKLFAYDDLTCEEQQFYDDTLVCDEG